MLPLFPTALSACGGPPPSDPAPAALEAPEGLALLHTTPLGDTAALFYGEAVPQGTPARYGVSALWFALPGGERRPFTPTGTLYFSDWQFDIGSPDGARVLLLQDHYGPYHVVRVDHLSAYLQGGAPEAVIGYTPEPGGAAWVHREGRWSSANTVEYRAGLETTEVFTITLE